MECGGKRSATPLFLALRAYFRFGTTIQSGVALRLPSLAAALHIFLADSFNQTMTLR